MSPDTENGTTNPSFHFERSAILHDFFSLVKCNFRTFRPFSCIKRHSFCIFIGHFLQSHDSCRVCNVPNHRTKAMYSVYNQAFWNQSFFAAQLDNSWGFGYTFSNFRFHLVRVGEWGRYFSGTAVRRCLVMPDKEWLYPNLHENGYTYSCLLYTSDAADE